MKRLRILFDLSCLLALVLGGILIVLVYFSWAPKAHREALVRAWSRLLLRLFGMTIEIRGAWQPQQAGQMLLLNHVSWIDVYVIDAVVASRFVAKSEIRNWPLIGALSARSGTIFVERAKRSALLSVIADVTQALKAGDSVAFFPEGTTSEGAGLLPFHANLVQAAINAAAPVIPVTLRYLDASGQRTPAVFYGDESLLASAQNVLRARPLRVELTFSQPIPTMGANRHQVAADARRAMLLALGAQPDAAKAALLPLASDAARTDR